MSERRPGVRFVVRGLTQRLPGRRGAAARAVLVGARDLVTGRGPASTYAPGDPPIDPLALVRADRAAGRGDDANALAILATIVARHPDSLVALSFRREIEERQGRWPEALATIRAMRAVRDTRDLACAERGLVGRILLDDPRWLPRVPGPRPAAGKSRAILHLLVAGGGASTNDHEQMPAERAIRAGRAAGLTPVVLRVPGPEAASRPRPQSDGGGGDGRDTSGSEVEAVAWPIDLPG
jgi:hypothetical protein